MEPALIPALSSGVDRAFTIPGRCGIPVTAEAVSVNVTVVGASGPGYLTFYREGEAPPATAAITFAASLARSNSALLGLSREGGLGVRSFVGGAGQVHLVVDVAGYVD